MTKIIVIDDFLPSDTFSMLSCMYRINDTNEVDRYIFKHDPTPQIAEFINYFDKKRGYETLGKFIHTASTPPNFTHKIHDEAEFKIMSAVVYIGPKQSHGTTFYLEEQFEIQWKPNRLMVFCGETDVTWHDYKSTEETRLTYNYFLVDPTKVQNETYRNHILRM